MVVLSPNQKPDLKFLLPNIDFNIEFPEWEVSHDWFATALVRIICKYDYIYIYIYVCVCVCVCSYIQWYVLVWLFNTGS